MTLGSELDDTDDDSGYLCIDSKFHYLQRLYRHPHCISKASLHTANLPAAQALASVADAHP